MSSPASRAEARAARLGVLALVVAALVTSGCQLGAAHGELATFRALRRETALHRRLALIDAYTRSYPHGVWAADVEAVRETLEPETWRASSQAWTIDGLEHYLSAYPDGAHAPEALTRLEALSAAIERAPGEDPETTRRLWVGRAMEFWTRTLPRLAPLLRSLPAIAHGDPAFSDAFGADPAPDCSALECLKTYHSSFSVAGPSGPVTREMEVVIRITLGTRGRVERIEVLLPRRGFSRWYELETNVFVDDASPTDRDLAITWARHQLRQSLDALGSAARRGPIFTLGVVPLVTGSSLAAPTAPPDVLESIGLPALHFGVFAASDADTGAAYDGFYIEPALP